MLPTLMLASLEVGRSPFWGINFSYKKISPFFYTPSDSFSLVGCLLFIFDLLKGNKMLSIEYTHKRSRLFRIELSLIVIATFVVLIFVWQILSILKFLK